MIGGGRAERRQGSREDIRCLDGVLHLAPVEVDGSNFANMLVSALRAHTGTGQDLRGVLVEPPEAFVLCIHFLCNGLKVQKKKK